MNDAITALRDYAAELQAYLHQHETKDLLRFIT
jgi:hypothetical protein